MISGWTWTVWTHYTFWRPKAHDLSAPVESDEPLEAEERDEHGAGPHRLPEVGGLVGVRRPQLGQQDEEDVEEEEHVARDAEQTRQVRDPLNPALQPQGGLYGFIFWLFKTETFHHTDLV